MPTAEPPQFTALSRPSPAPVVNSVRHRRCDCGISTVFSTSAPENEVQLWISTVSSQTAPRSLPDLHNQHQPPCQCTATGELHGLLNSETMGTCLCAPTGMMTTLLMNCNSGFSTVFCTARRTGSGHLSCTQRARQPCPRAAPVESHEEAAQFAPVRPNNGHINSLSRNCNRGISMVC